MSFENGELCVKRDKPDARVRLPAAHKLVDLNEENPKDNVLLERQCPARSELEGA